MSLTKSKQSNTVVRGLVLGQGKAIAHSKPAPLVLPTTPSKGTSTFKQALCLFYGAPGVGKTTFVNDLTKKKVLFISTDRGTKYLEAMRVECNSWTALEQIVDSLKQSTAAYEFICLDHVDDICNMAEVATCEEMNIEALADADWGKAWKAYETKLRSLVQSLLSLKIGLIFIAHSVIRPIESRSIKIDTTMPALAKAAGRVLIPMLDIIGHITIRSFKTTDGHRIEKHILQTQPKEELYCKDRTDRKKPKQDYEVLDADKFLETFSA